MNNRIVKLTSSLKKLPYNLAHRGEEKSPAQILVVTLVVLLIVSLTVVSIASTAARNSRQVAKNVEYEKAYNYAESQLLQVVDTVLNTNFQLSNLPGSGLNGMTCRLRQAGTQSYACSKSETEANRRTVLQISDTNIVENYELGAGDYFNINLDNGSANGYQGNVQLAWDGAAAFDLELVYESTLAGTRRLRSEHHIIDNNNPPVYNNSGTSLFTVPPVVSNNSVVLRLSQVQPSKIVGTTPRFVNMKVRAISRTAGTLINIRPSGGTNLPNQIRRIEAFSYRTDAAETSAPVVMTQLPLLPSAPAPLSLAVNATRVVQPFCGNGVIEGAEQCEGSANGCSNCRLPIQMAFVADYRPCEDTGSAFSDCEILVNFAYTNIQKFANTDANIRNITMADFRTRRDRDPFQLGQPGTLIDRSPSANQLNNYKYVFFSSSDLTSIRPQDNPKIDYTNDPINVKVRTAVANFIDSNKANNTPSDKRLYVFTDSSTTSATMVSILGPRFGVGYNVHETGSVGLFRVDPSPNSLFPNAQIRRMASISAVAMTINNSGSDQNKVAYRGCQWHFVDRDPAVENTLPDLDASGNLYNGGGDADASGGSENNFCAWYIIKLNNGFEIHILGTILLFGGQDVPVSQDPASTNPNRAVTAEEIKKFIAVLFPQS